MNVDELIERLGQLIDKVDNYLEYRKGGAWPLAMRADAMGTGLDEIRQEILAIYEGLGGDDVWGGRNE